MLADRRKYSQMDSYSDSISQNTGFNSWPIVVQFFVLIGLFISGMLVGSLLGLLVLIPFYGLDIIDSLRSDTGPMNYDVLRIMQMIATITTFAVPALILSELKTGDYWSYFKPVVKFEVRNLFWLPVLLVLIYPLIGLSYEWNQAVSFPEVLSGLETWLMDKEAAAMEMMKGFLDSTNFGVFLINFIMIGILPAICEELFFRGGMQKLLYRCFSVHFAIWLSAFIFSAIHMQFYGFLPRFILGLFLGYIYYWTKNIWVPIVLHLINNGVQVILIYLGQQGVVDVDVESEFNAPLGLTLGMTLIFGIACYYFYQNNHQKNLDSYG